MYGELAVALFIMLVVLMSVVFFSEKYRFPFLEVLEERKEQRSKVAERAGKNKESSGGKRSSG